MIYQGDLRIKAALTLGLEDISKNLWLIDDILGDTVSNEYMRQLYGSQIESCKQWISNNRVNILLSMRDDKVEFPAITIELGSIDEKMDMRHMADLSTESVKLLPNNINKPIPYIVKPASGSYNPTTGIFTFNTEVNLTSISPKMILVNPTNGTGYVIQNVAGKNQINLLMGLSIEVGSYGIIPEYQYYESKVGHTFMKEDYDIVCHGMDQQTLLWLHTIVTYILLRYRQTLLESQGGAESVIRSTKMYPNPDYSDAGQVIWSRSINLSLQTESRWIMQPHRLLETSSLGQGGLSTPENPDGFTGGLKIISNKNDIEEDLSTVNWSTIAESLE